MNSSTAVEIIADVTDMSVDQFVKSIALDRFIQLQEGQTDVSVCFHDNNRHDVYQPALDVSLADAAMPVDEAVARFRLDLFAEEFLQPFCASLLQGDDGPTRSTLEEHFDSLKQLAVPARQELSELGESGLMWGPKQREFESFAEDLVSFSTRLILSRVCDQRNEKHLRRLMTRLKLAST